MTIINVLEYFADHPQVAIALIIACLTLAGLLHIAEHRE
jgi:hypothetical protein